MESKKSEKPKKPTKLKRAKKPKSKKPHYVNAKDFTADITTYYESGTDDIGNKLGESIYKIAKGQTHCNGDSEGF